MSVTADHLFCGRCLHRLLSDCLSYPGTIEYEAELRHKNEMSRVQAEIQGK